MDPGAPIFYSTLDDFESLAQPAAGAGTDAVVSTDPERNFVATKCESGLLINANGEYFGFKEVDGEVQNIDYRRGSLSFFFDSSFDSDDQKRHVFFSTVNPTGPSGFLFEKAATNDLRFVVTPTSGAAFLARVAPGAFVFSHGTRIHFLVSWDFGLGGGVLPVKLYLDGNRLTLLGAPPALTMRVAIPEGKLRFGSLDDDNTFAGGVFDDLRIYGAAIDK